MGEIYTNLVNVYTKKGDSGDTGLYGGSRVSKTDIKVETYGSIDEASSFIGVARAIIKDEKIKTTLYKIQEKFIVIGGYLSSDRKGVLKLKEKISDDDVDKLEKEIDYFSKELLPLTNFVIPGENIQSSSLHVARTVVRRSERKIVHLKERREVPKEILKYINRTSDLLFILARVTEGQEAISCISRDIMERIEKLESKTWLMPGKSGGKGRDMESKNMLSLEDAKEIVSAGEKKAAEMGKDFVFAVVNSEGNLILEEKMDNAILASTDIALKKAYTSAALKMPTSELADLVKPGGSLYGLHADSKYVVFGGGYPLEFEGKIIGAVGVSGGTVEEDITIVDACVESFIKRED
ncbi:cob(I)yrinic acid a,c-diamide adenosyltransferase [uncultured Ilyobacter sp.]|uniref:cob(I)yrinic acid a,c-diamide adenosyltransferase n=1 Tax=uncultured Ilyobacter sp. TaxID=544433 RepID=UPI0029BFCEF8|nr:cob(I)yrinic acid a,c-diamide adenosyltransferase [uncultured Ilyobacter sp.]